jgi:hypothetical protein
MQPVVMAAAPNQTRTQQFARSFGLNALDGKQQIGELMELYRGYSSLKR